MTLFVAFGACLSLRAQSLLRWFSGLVHLVFASQCRADDSDAGFGASWQDKAEKLIEEAKASQAKSEALAAQDTVGVSLVLDEDFNEKVGYDKDKRLNFANELRLDLAAALYTSEDRFVVCGLQPGQLCCLPARVFRAARD